VELNAGEMADVKMIGTKLDSESGGEKKAEIHVRRLKCLL